jgi:hypothetical protein
MRDLTPMTVIGIEARLRYENERSMSLPLPALPVPHYLSHHTVQSVPVPPVRKISPQAMETALVRLENLRSHEITHPAQSTPLRMHEKRVQPGGYKPVHLCYQTAEGRQNGSYVSSKKSLSLEALLWRIVGILCLVLAVVAVIALLATGYNQL